MRNLLDLLNSIPAGTETERQTLLAYIKTASMGPDHWKVLKTIYKQYELTPDAEITAAIIAKLDQSPFGGSPVPYPTPKTLAYMKRRARRFLRTLPDDQLYFEITRRILLEYAGKEPFYFEHQWITADILLGHSHRLTQAGHGRGKVTFAATQYHLHRAEERRPAIWDGQINFVDHLLEKTFPWPLQEFALKVLRRNGLKFPVLSPSQVNRFLESPSLLLKRIAVDQVERDFWKERSPTTSGWAVLLVFGSTKLQQELISSDWARQSPDRQKNILTTLLEHVSVVTAGPKLSRRLLRVLLFLHQFGRSRIAPAQVLSIAGLLLRSGRKELEEWAFGAAEKATPEQALVWFNAASQDHQLGRLTQLFTGKFKNVKLDTAQIEPFIFHPSFVVCQFGWQLLQRNSRYFYYTVGTIWTALFKGVGNPQKEKFLFNALQSGTAAEIFTKYYSDYEYLLSNENTFSRPAFFFILRHGIEPYQKFLQKKLVEWFKDQPFSWLPLLSQLPADLPNDLFRRAVPQLQKSRLFAGWAFMGAINQSPQLNDPLSFWKLFFRLVEVSDIPPEDVRNMIGLAADHTPAITGILTHLSLLADEQKKSWFLEAFGDLLEKKPELLVNLDAAQAHALIDRLSPSSLITLVLVMQESGWGQMRELIYQRIKQVPDSGVFWRDVLEKMTEADTGNVLFGRLFGESRFMQLFLNQSSSEILEVKHPAAETILDQWLQRNLAALGRNSIPLYQACTHPLPLVRNRALAFALTDTIHVPFMVRLMESDLPPVREAVQPHLEKIEAGSPKEWDAILALCDSPNSSARRFGIILGQTRQKACPADKQAQLLEFLSEHSAPEMQHWIAKDLLNQPVEKSFVQRFDKEVLRMKNRSREAKENIKQRQERSPTVSVEVLLEMARSGHKLDAEWAIWALTQRTLSGEEIEGFELK